jgi:hypothetical protein
MKCKKCSHRFFVSDGQPAPGGSSSPGCFFPFFMTAVGAAIWFGLTNPISLFWTIPISITFCMINIIAYYDCRRLGTNGKPGNMCRKCGTINKMWPWSL